MIISFIKVSIGLTFCQKSVEIVPLRGIVRWYYSEIKIWKNKVKETFSSKFFFSSTNTRFLLIQFYNT